MIKTFIEKVKVWFEENAEYICEFLRGVFEGMKNVFAFTGFVVCLGFWLGHPEMVMSEKFNKLIVKNYKG